MGAESQQPGEPPGEPETDKGEASAAPTASVEAQTPARVETRAERSPKKTPIWQAMQASRYHRQALIKQIIAKRNRELICYVGGMETEISRNDVVFFVDLLHNVPRQSPLDFLLHTKGGDMDAAEKLISMVREVVGTSELTVIVPDFAKSSGTMMALGADRIMMSDSSELGPIDPQIILDDGEGKRIVTSLHSYLSAYEEHEKAFRQNPDDPVARLMLQKFDPAKIHQLRLMKDRARQIAEKQLREGMFRPPRLGNTTGIPLELMNVGRYSSHGQMIGYREAKGLGLDIDYRLPGDELWELYWQLYCFQRLEIQDRKKLFESSYACLANDE